MSDTVLSSRWVVYYSAENRQKRIYRDVSVTPTVTDDINDLYSALQDLFDDLTQMDDGVPMSAQTPTEYTIGIIDAGDKDPWFIDRRSVEYLYGGALKTASWDRAQDTNVGIIKITCSATAFGIVAGDIGNDITTGAGDSGTLLDVNTSTYEVWIRPDSYAAANNFDSSDTLTCNAHTATFTYSGTSPYNPVSNGESLWSNIYSIGTIESNTHIYINQNGSNLVAYKASTDWWGDGHIDILVQVKELGIESDEGYITVLARQYSKTYSYYIVDLTNGGRNPIPLQTGNDLDNQTGIWQMDLAVSSGTFVDGEVIRDDSDSTIQGVVTSWEGTNKIIEYYLIGDPPTNNFGAGTGAFTGLTSSATGTAVAPTAIGSSDLAPSPTIRHGASATRLSSSDGGDFDVDENGTFENYSIVIDCVDTHALTTMYEWSKYITRRSETTSTETDGLQGQFYIGSDYRITYTGSVTGTLDDGDVVTQEVTGATGTIVYHNTAVGDKIIILRNSRGTFVKETVAGNRTLSSPSGSVEVDVDPVAITPIAAAPFGTFAGGKWFCAPGVVLDNYLDADLNNFQLTDDTGTVRVAPTKVNVTVGNTKLGDKIAVFRLTGENEDIEKNYYACVGGESAGGTSLVVTPSMRVDEPGKASGGVIRLVDSGATTEYRIRFSTWATATFTLASQTGLTADGSGCDSDTLTDTGQSFTTTVRVGDLLRNTTEGVVAYVTAVVSDTELTTTPVTNWTGDSYQINTLPVAPEAANDKVYIPFIDAYETADGSEVVQVVYDTTVYTRVRARRSGVLSNRIIPFEQDSSIGTNGMSVSVIRTPDTIVT